MAYLHDAPVRDALRTRIRLLKPDAPRRWGKMTVDQMLWHVSESLRAALGQTHPHVVKPPLPRALLRFLVLNVPWPRGAPTHPDFVAGDRYGFEEEKIRCLNFIEAFAQKSLDAEWPESATLGPMTGRSWSRLQAKHLDHHLRQFGS